MILFAFSVLLSQSAPAETSVPVIEERAAQAAIARFRGRGFSDEAIAILLRVSAEERSELSGVWSELQALDIEFNAAVQAAVPDRVRIVSIIERRETVFQRMRTAGNRRIIDTLTSLQPADLRIYLNMVFPPPPLIRPRPVAPVAPPPLISPP